MAGPEAQMGTKPKHRMFPLDVEEILFNWESDQTLAEVAHRCHGISYPGDIQKSSGHGPGPLAPNGPSGAGGLDPLSSQSPFPMELLSDSFGMGLH